MNIKIKDNSNNGVVFIKRISLKEKCEKQLEDINKQIKDINDNLRGILYE